MKLIVGLGNPGAQYANTRHNVGFEVIDILAEHIGSFGESKEAKALVHKVNYKGEKLLLVKPQTYMNLSGVSVRALVDYYKIDLEKDLLIVYDDIDLPIGSIRVRSEGSAGGHNGMKNIVQYLGTTKIPRVRIGIDPKPPYMDLADYVLSRFEKADREAIEEGLRQGAKAVLSFLEDGIEKTMNQYNRKREV